MRPFQDGEKWGGGHPAMGCSHPQARLRNKKISTCSGLEQEPRPRSNTEVFSAVNCSETQSPYSRCKGKWDVYERFKSPPGRRDAGIRLWPLGGIWCNSPWSWPQNLGKVPTSRKLSLEDRCFVGGKRGVTLIKYVRGEMTAFCMNLAFKGHCCYFSG